MSRINDYLQTHKYDEEIFWKENFDKPVEELWAEYNKQFASQ